MVGKASLNSKTSSLLIVEAPMSDRGNSGKDRLQLICAGGVIATLAWTFWHLLDKDAFPVLSTIMLLFLVADNVRLRRQLRRNSTAQESDT
jgi:hypothetical protein